MKVNNQNETIIITKKENQELTNINSTTFSDLSQLKSLFPTYKIVVNESKRKNAFKGLTKDKMYNYILTHDNEAKSKMEEFKILCSLENEFGEKHSIGELVQWFRAAFPEVDEFAKRQQSIMQNAKDTLCGRQNVPL